METKQYTITLDSNEMQIIKEALVLLYDERRGDAGEVKVVSRLLENAEKDASELDARSALTRLNIEMVRELNDEMLRALYFYLIHLSKKRFYISDEKGERE